MVDATDVFLYSIDSVLAQVESARETLGFFELRFYSDGKRPAQEVTALIETFYYYPSGGTLRDKEMNIIFYEPKLDAYSSASRIQSREQDS